jgi:hypothetical protein
MSISHIRDFSSRSFEVLLIGDSLDRYMILDWCDHLASFHRQDMDSNPAIANDPRNADFKISTWMTFPQNWTNNKLDDGWLMSEVTTRYEHGFRCRDPKTGDVLSATHIYGSSDAGPYFRGFINKPGFDYLDTKPRVQFILENYMNKFGFPDVVIFHSTQWDTKLYYDVPGNPYRKVPWNETLAMYEANINRRVDQLELILQNYTENSLNHGHTRIGLRTSVINLEWPQHPLLMAINNITRTIAKQRHLILFDYNDDLWSFLHNQYYGPYKEAMFRDIVHPNTKRCIIAAEKILGRRYSNAMHNYGLREEELAHDVEPRLDGHALAHQLKHHIVYLIRSDKQLYFIHRLSQHHPWHGRWSLGEVEDNHAMPILNRILELGSADVLDWKNDSAIIEATVDRGIFPLQEIGNATYILASLQVEESQPAIRALIFLGNYFVVKEQDVWDRWLKVTPATAVIKDPLESFWSQHENSILSSRGDLETSRQPGKIFW